MPIIEIRLQRFAKKLETRSQHDTDFFPYTLIRRSTRRTVAISIKPDGSVVVLAPSKASERQIHHFVIAHIGWVTERLAHIKKRHAEIPIRAYEDGERLPYLGHHYTIRTRPERRIQLTNEAIELPNISIDNRYQTLVKWYKARAQDIFFDRIELYQPRVGHQATSFKLSNATSRWGACTSRGAITLRWTLIMAPLSIIDYVVIHELCHLVHMNHSRSFWKLVKSICPEYKVAVEWLKTNGHLLTLQRPEE